MPSSPSSDAGQGEFALGGSGFDGGTAVIEFGAVAALGHITPLIVVVAVAYPSDPQHKRRGLS
ncbi:MAG: hypothetical protein WD990_13490 [Acidimicrobiia bacterium]